MCIRILSQNSAKKGANMEPINGSIGSPNLLHLTAS